MIALLASFVEEVVLIFLVDLAIVVPVLGREALLQRLDHPLQTQLALPASLQELDEMTIATVGKHVAHNRPQVLRLALQRRASA